MKDIITKLYYGDLQESEVQNKTNEKAEKAERQAAEALFATFNDEQKRLFDAFYEALMGTLSEDKAHTYKRGMQMGFWLGLELYNFEI